jgi:hypothetical protein
MIYRVNTKVEIVKPAFEGQSEQFSRVGQQGITVDCSIPGMVCVHFDDMAEGIGMFFNASEVRILDK